MCVRLHIIAQPLGQAFLSDRLAPGAVSVAIFRDPRERILSRYYFDLLHGKTNRGVTASKQVIW